MSDRSLYGQRHRAERAKWQRILDDGVPVNCSRCGAPINPDPSTWDLGHKRDRQGWSGPQHVDCNRRTRAHMSADRKREPRKHPSDL